MLLLPLLESRERCPFFLTIVSLCFVLLHFLSFLLSLIYMSFVHGGLNEYFSWILVTRR